jgi:hypothetical protein
MEYVFGLSTAQTIAIGMLSRTKLVENLRLVRVDTRTNG